MQIPEIRGEKTLVLIRENSWTKKTLSIRGDIISFTSKEIKMKCKDNSVSVVCKGQALRVASENLPFCSAIAPQKEYFQRKP